MSARSIGRGFLVAVVLVGCQSFGAPGDALDQVGRPAKAERPGRGSTASKPDRPAAVGDDSPQPVLANGAWIRRVPGKLRPAPATRWRHIGLEDLLSRPPGRRPDFKLWLNDQNSVVAANAAVALARLGEGNPAERLAEAIRSPHLKMPLRSAAAEALGQVRHPSPVGALRELLDQYGQSERAAPQSYLPGLHAELIRALGRHVVADDEPRLLGAFASRSAEVQLAALELWPPVGPKPLPKAILQMASAADARVRVAAIRLIADRAPRQAATLVERSLADHDLQVRLAAIAALGKLTQEPLHKAKLVALLDSRGEIVRAAAVDALAEAGDFEHVHAAGEDRSWRVRKRVAMALKNDPTAAGANVARRLVGDPNMQVARAVITSVRGWAIESAGRVLFDGIQSASQVVRQEAADQLAARWEPGHEFPATAAQSQRRQVLAKLRSRWDEQYGPPRTAAARGTPHRQVAVADQDRRHVRGLLDELARRTLPAGRRADIEGTLAAMGPRLVATLEAVIDETRAPLPEPIYQDVLPRVDPTFETLARLADPNLTERRQAAQQLAEETASARPATLALRRLAELLIRQQDPLVWQSVQTALGDETREPAVRIQIAGLTHPVAEVRRRACAYLADRALSEHQGLLVAALDDSDRAVVLEAIRGLAAIGTLDDPTPLVQLLASRDESIRLQVAAALAKLGDRRGQAALQRLAHARDPDVRRGAARTMGQLGNAGFTATLMQMLDDRLDVKQAAVRSLEQVSGAPATEADAEPHSTLEQRVSRLRRWYARGGHAGAH